MAIVLGIVTVSVMPRFRSRWLRFQDERAAFTVAQFLRAARSLAVTESHPMAWILNEDSHRMWIAEEHDDGSTQPVPGSLGAPRQLPEAVTLHALREDHAVDRIDFFPDGTAQPTTVVIGDDPAAPSYHITVDAATGQVTVSSPALPAAT